MTDHFGTLETIDDQYQVRFVRTLPHPPAKVWQALTEPEHLDAWFPTTIEGERRAGAELRFSFREHDLPSFEGRMITCDPPSVLELDWGPDRLRFELAPDAGGTATVLTLTDLIDSAEQGKAARDSAGWHLKLDQLAYVVDHLGDGTAPPSDTDQWEAVNQRYVERFPAAASTVGPPQAYHDAVDRARDQASSRST
jgi:uncharacterized protein YndB with AHSA1/START domain